MSSQKRFSALNIAVLTISDTRNEDTDTSGQYLVNALKKEGHQLADKAICIDDIYQMRAQVSAWIADDKVQVILCTGGTGFSGRDSTPEALTPILDKSIPGFGELFRHLSYADIGTSTIQSRAFAGMANSTLIFAMPGSTGACRLAWDDILRPQLDSRTRPCHFVSHLQET